MKNCNHCYPIIQCENCGKESLAPKTKAEERLIEAALRFKKQIWNGGDGVCRAATAVLKEREKK